MYRRVSGVVVALALTFTGCSSDNGDQSQTAPEEASPTATATPAPPPTATPVPDPADDDIVLADTAGPYQVGVETIVVEDPTEDGRDLTVDVWFPLADGAADTLAAHQYTFLPGTFYESPTAVSAMADNLSPDGPFPLVVYSHGSGGIRYIHSNYTEAIASYGYIVVAPDHTGNTATDRLTGGEADFGQTAFNRPSDVTAVIDAFTSDAQPATESYSSSVDPDAIAVTGHSFGGFTAYATAGGHDGPGGSYPADARVGAIIPLAPAAGEALITDAELASITIPSLVIGGTDDKTTPIDPNVTRPWELISSSPAYRVDLIAAEHQTFTDVCAYQESLGELEGALQVVVDLVNDYAQEGCLPEDMPADRAQAITNTFAVRFLESVFRDGSAIAPAEVDGQSDLIYLVK